MGIAIAFVFVTIVGVALLAVGGAGAFAIVGRFARPEVRGVARCLVIAVMMTALLFAALLGPQIAGQAGVTSAVAPTELWRQRCEEAGETIYRTIENVPGIYYEAYSLAWGRPGGRFHSDEGRPELFLRRADGVGYDFVENRSRSDSLVERYLYRDGKLVVSRHDAPSARYGYTWNSLNSFEEADSGIYGEEIEIFDVVTREVLARRVLYYYDPKAKPVPHGQPVPICPELPHSRRYVDGQPRDSYDFVSRVLKPAP